MIVDITKLDSEGSEFRGEEPPEVFDLGDTEDTKPAGPIRYDLRVSLAGDSIVANGVLKADVAFECVRCAEFFRVAVCDPEFSVVREIVDKDEAIDLTPDIRESIILAFPTNPLCAPGCRGLCPRCGTNLNKKKCRCADSSADDRWSALGNLKLK